MRQPPDAREQDTRLASTYRPSLVELRLVVVGPDGAAHDLAVETAPDLRARDLLAAIGEELGLDARAATIDGERLPEDGQVSELGLRWGDELRLGERAAAAVRPVAELVVDGGPETGRRVELGAGTFTIGRAADISLEDPSLSGHHVVLTIDADAAATVADAGSRNGTTVDGTPLDPGRAAPLAPGTLVRAGRSLLAVHEPGPASRPPATSGLLQVNRPPRVQRPPQARRRPFPAPPGESQRARLPLAASLIPLVLGIGLYLLTGLAAMLFFSLLAPVMAVSTFVEDRRSGRKGYQKHAREYRRSLAALRDELEAERAAELADRRAAAPSAATLSARARRHDPALWERRPGDDDFVELRLGTADLPSLLTVELDSGGSGELRAQAEQVIEWYATVPAAPLTIRAADAGTIGIAGPSGRVESLARSLVAQAAALHSPAELAIAAAVAPGGDWDWLKWLPHADDSGGRPTPWLGVGPTAAREGVEEVGRLVTGRRGDGGRGVAG